jgi:glutathione S-transferase
LAAVTTNPNRLLMAASSPPPPDAAAATGTNERTIALGWPKVTLYGDLNMRPFRNLWMLEEIGLPYAHVACRPWSRIAGGVHPLGKVPALLVEGRSRRGGADGGGGDGGPFVMLESAAINTYLGDMARELESDPLAATPARDGPLVPPPATFQRARYDSLVTFVVAEIDSQSLWIHRKHSRGGGLSRVFGEAPAAVDEARRQFGGALDFVVGEISGAVDAGGGGGGDGDIGGGGEGGYLLSTGFSAADIIFANCCFWAQQIGWLERGEAAANVNAGGTSGDGETTAAATTRQKHLVQELGAYLERCRSRPAFKRANELRRVQSFAEEEGSDFPNKDSRL